MAPYQTAAMTFTSKQVTFILRERWTRGDRRAKSTVKEMVPTDAGRPALSGSY